MEKVARQNLFLWQTVGVDKGDAGWWFIPECKDYVFDKPIIFQSIEAKTPRR
jgi:hypothetical protein